MGLSAVTVSKADGGAAVVTLAKEPVNSMNLDLWRQLQAALDQCEQDPEVRTAALHLAAGFRSQAQVNTPRFDRMCTEQALVASCCVPPH